MISGYTFLFTHNCGRDEVDIMNDKIVQLVKGFLPDAEILKTYQDDSGQIKIDIKMGDSVMVCSVKKNHAGELYIE